MAKILEAKAVITADDKTGAVFDGVAKKIEGVNKAAKAFKGLPPLAAKGWGEGVTKELEKLKAGTKEIAAIQRSWENFNKALFSKGPVGAAKGLEAIKAWNRETVRGLRDVRLASEQAAKSHEKFQRTVGGRIRSGMHYALGAVGVGGGIYAAERGLSAVAHSASDRQREAVRYQQAGLTAGEYSRANAIADQISAKYPSLSRTEVLKYMRQNTARLGSFDRASTAAEPYAQALIANKLSGGDEHEMEQVVLALEGMGKANTAEQLTRGLNTFARAKALNPDYTGDKFARDMRAASASKYGLSQDYMDNVFPFLAAHSPGFGNAMATGMSALIGGRQKKESIALLKKQGLWTGGHLLDEKGYIANNFDWTQKYIRPRVEKELGVKFSEDMSEEDKGKVTDWATKSFSARKAADLIITNLLDAPLVEKARRRHAANLDQMGGLQRQDGGLSWEAAKTQIGDLTTAILNLNPVIAGLNKFADTLSGITNSFNKGSTADKTGALFGATLLGGGAAYGGLMAARGAYQWFTGGSAALNASAAALDGSAAALTAAAYKLAGGKAVSDIFSGPQGALNPAALKGEAAAAGAAAAGGSIWSKVGTGALTAVPYAAPLALGTGAGLALWDMVHQPDYDGLNINSDRLRRERGGSVRDAMRRAFNEDRRRLGIPEMGPDGPIVTDTMTYGTGVGGDKGHVSVSGTVEGQATIVLKVEAGSSLIQIAEQAQQALKLAGQVNSNGPGSSGKSSPDAAAPAVGFNGVP